MTLRPERTTMTTDQTPNPESARALLYRHGVPEDVIDGALCLHAQELAALQRAVPLSGVEAGVRDALADLIDPSHDEQPAVVPVPPPADRTALRAALTPAERTMLAYALDQAQEHIWSRGGFTDEDQAAVDSLRRMAAEEQPAETDPQPESCAHCGKNIRRITGTLTEWWVHAQGGQSFCYPWQPAKSPRATPKPAAGEQPDTPPRP